MADETRKFEIEQADGGFRIRIINPVTPNPWEYYKCHAIKSIVGVDIANHGLRDAVTLQRKNPTRHTDKREIIITFIDDDTTPVRYNIEDVDNQPGWTNDTAGLLQALQDINGWCADVATAINAVLTGNVEAPSFVEALANGSTSAGVKAVSITFDGTGGTLAAVAVPDGFSQDFSASLSNSLSAIAFTVPTGGAQRVLLAYVT